jgi:hypothetical protein
VGRTAARQRAVGALRLPIIMSVVASAALVAVVAPINGAGLVDQFLRFNTHAAGHDGYRPAGGLPPSDAMSHEAGSSERHGVRIDDWIAAGRVIVRHVTVEGMGHAWSGGNAALAFADPLGPDALELLARFAADSHA